MSKAERPAGTSQAGRWVVVAAGICVALTLTVILIPALRSPYPASWRVAIETAATLAAGIAAALAYVRGRASRRLADVLLCATLALLAVTNAAFALAPALTAAPDTPFSTWAPLLGRLLGALGFLAAAFAGDRCITRVHRTMLAALAGAVLLPALIAVLVTLLGDRLPLADREVNPAIVVAHLLSMTAFAAAAYGFVRSAHIRADITRTGLAVAMTVAAASRLNSFLHPSPSSDYAYVGDLFRLGWYLVLLAVTVAEILTYERRLGQLAVFQERRRLARDLHDGLAQELAFISAQAQRLRGEVKPEIAAGIAQAATRAVQEARAAISALVQPVDESLAAALERAATTASRGEADVHVSAPDDLQVEPHVREALVRIAGEAAGNAVRHGGARRVQIELRRDRDLRLRVVDDGGGFDTDAPPRPDSFGLTSMRERALNLKGTLHVMSRPGSGTTVEVTVPE